ncbi:MAG: extracellular solute-binding protein [Spirochaetales bacterium]|nr:extracellular solute-binding protein [Spirochaetales bacterium]
MKREYFLFFLLPLLFFACQKEEGENRVPSTGPEPLELEMLVYANQGMVKNYRQTLARFEESQDEITVNLLNLRGEDWSDFEHALRSRILSGKSPDIIDVSVVYRDALINEGLLLDLMPFIESNNMDLSLYFENQLSGLRRGESLYGIPSGALLMAAYVNKDLFREAGVELPGLKWDDTWDWEEYARKTEAIRAYESPERETYGTTQFFTIGWIIPFLLNNGSDFLTSQRDDCTAENRAARETFRFLKELLFDKGVSPDMMQLTALQPYQHFFDGRVGVLIEGNWWMEAARENITFDWGVVPLPQNPPYGGTGLYVDNWAIPYDAPHPEESFRVLQFFLEEEQQKSGIMKGIPPLKSSAHEIYTDRFPNLSQEEIDVWFEGISLGTTPAYFRGWNDFQNESTDILKDYSFSKITLDEMLEQLCASYEKNRKRDYR